MAEEHCVECGCEIGDKAYETDGNVYCCEPCASSCECECGWLDEGDEEEEE